MKKAKFFNMRRKAITLDVASYIFLGALSLVWVFPLFWLLLTSFRGEPGQFTTYFFPRQWTLNNYIRLFTDTTFNYWRWMLNTITVAVCSMFIATFLNLSTAYVMSRYRFRWRNRLLKISLILGMFPGFMSMIAVYYLLLSVGLTQRLVALVAVYSLSAGLGFFIAKGFFDTIPRALDEAARIDGASGAMVYFRVVLPMSKPIMVYTALMAFLAPWMDFIFANIIMFGNRDGWTVAVGLYNMIVGAYASQYATTFAAGAVLVAVPITTLFIFLQKYFVEGVTGGAVKG